MDSPKSKRKPAQAASRGRRPIATAPAAVAKARKPPARAASHKKTIARDLLSDDDDEANDPLSDDDGDDDYKMGNDDDEDESERMPPQRTTKGKQAATSTRRAAAPKKRLRQRVSDDDDNDDFDDTSPPRKRAAPTPKSRARATPAKRITQKDTQGDKIDLCSSDEDRAPVVTAPKRKSQSRINEMFQWQQQQSHLKTKNNNGGDDDVESDAEFTQLAAAKAADTQSEFSQPQASQAFDGGVKRRKLPLSMVATSQTSTQSGTLKRDSEATSTIRKGWGRSRR
jgi:hypothetical protein